eukprot:TRINITY_DN28684_c0_g2_i1.p1 TRINITY_DN28684_c0_g2~~TRINITY_DN28684_c0_g2_i1.p1  ORF type:complete len:222 (-),score=35.73 TRINITY_DN28684_c0_g2_i1:646-1311(-)
MWTDRYCYVFQCGASDVQWGEESRRPPIAALMFPPSLDASFGMSLSGMIWPRAGISGAALWNYNPNVDTEMVEALFSWFADLLRSRGISSCPGECACDELTSCGAPYPVRMSGKVGVRDCFSLGSVKDIGDCPPRGYRSAGDWSLDEALSLCFWLGRGCSGVSCVGNSTAGDKRKQVQGALHACTLHGPASCSDFDPDSAGRLTVWAKIATHEICVPPWLP